MATCPARRRAGPDAARQAGIRVRQPLARLWLALPGGDLARAARRCSSCSRDEVNVKAVELIGDESDLVERRVKPLLPKIGKRLGRADPGRHGRRPRGRRRVSTPDGSVTLGGRDARRRTRSRS